MRYKFLDKNYNQKNYLLIKEKTKVVINGTINYLMTNSSFKEKMASLTIKQSYYGNIDKTMSFYSTPEQVPDVKSYIQSTVIPELNKDVQERLVSALNDNPEEVKFIPEAEEINEGLFKASASINPNNISIELIPIEEKDIEIAVGNDYNKIMLEKEESKIKPEKKLSLPIDKKEYKESKEESRNTTSKTLPTAAFGVYYKPTGEWIQSEDPNSLSGKTGFQSTRAKNSPHIANAIASKRMYYLSGQSKSVQLANAAMLINNHYGLKYKISYKSNNNERIPLGYFRIIPARPSYIYKDNSGKVHGYRANYKKYKNIVYPMYVKYSNTLTQTDKTAFEEALSYATDYASALNIAHKKSDLLNKMSTRKDLNMREEIFTKFVSETILTRFNQRFAFFSVKFDSTNNTIESAEQYNPLS